MTEEKAKYTTGGGGRERERDRESDNNHNNVFKLIQFSVPDFTPVFGGKL